MVYDVNTDRAVDIYLQSGTGRLTASEYNVTHTVSREQQNHEDDMMQVRKRLLFDYEFASAASGGNECTNIVGSSDKGVVGGHVDTAGDRMTSFIGCEEMAGYLYQWFEEYGGDGTDHSNRVFDGLGWFGKTHSIILAMFGGGDWGNPGSGYGSGSVCGSRSRVFCSGASRSYVYEGVGGRGVSQILRM